MATRRLAWLLVASLGLPLASADTPLALLDVIASDVSAQGLVDLSGPARAVLFRSFGNEDQGRFSFELHAESIHLEMDHAQTLAGASGVAVEGYLWQDEADYKDADLKVDAARAHFKLEILALEDGQGLQTRHVANCLNLVRPAGQHVETTKFAHSSRPIPSVAVGDSLESDLCAGLTEIAGDFLLVLWEIDIEVSDPGRTDKHHTGQAMADARGPQSATAPAQVPQSDQIYATVRGASLQLQRPPGTDGELHTFVTDANASVDGTVHASNAVGSILGTPTTPSEKAAVSMEGRMDLVAHAADADGLALQLSGSPERVVVNGAEQQLAATTVPGGIDVHLVALLLAAAAGILLGWRRLINSRRNFAESWSFRRARKLLSKGHPAMALPFAEAAVRTGPTPDAYALKARILLDLGRFKEAIEAATLADHDLEQAAHRGANALVASMSAARLDDPDNAGCWFVRATAADASLGEALQMDEPLHRVAARPAFQAWLASAPADSDLVRP